MSAGWDGQALIPPISAEQPCGENLEETPLLAFFDTFRLFGQASLPDPPPDWPAIKNQALEGLARSKDLRVLTHLGAALLRTDGLPAFSETLKVASQWLDTYWNGTYPVIDEDAIVRRSALNCFADHMAVIDGVRRAPLVSHRQLGRFSLRDVEMAAGQVQPGEADVRPDEAQINAAFMAMPLDELQGLRQSVLEASAALKSIDARMRGEAGEEAVPSFEPLAAQLVRVDRVLRTQLAARPDVEGMGESETGDGAAGAQSLVGPIKSRQDAIRALDAVAQFFKQTEPSSPLPLLLERAKRLVSKSFLEVVADLAPGALDQARAAAGLKDGE